MPTYQVNIALQDVVLNVRAANDDEAKNLAFAQALGVVGDYARNGAYLADIVLLNTVNDM